MENLFPVVPVITPGSAGAAAYAEEQLTHDCRRIDEALLRESSPTQLCAMLSQMLRQPLSLFDEALRPWNYLYEANARQAYEETFASRSSRSAEQILLSGGMAPKRRSRDHDYLLALGTEITAGYLLCPGSLLLEKSSCKLLWRGLVALTAAIQRANAIRRLSDRYYLSLFQNTQATAGSYALLNAEQIGFPVRGYHLLLLLRTDNASRSTEQRLQNLLKQAAYRDDARFAALQDEGLLLLAFARDTETAAVPLLETAKRNFPEIKLMCCEKKTDPGKHILAQASEFLQLACPLPFSPGLLGYWHLSLYNLMQMAGRGDIFRTGHAIVRQLITDSPKNIELLQTAAQYLDCNQSVTRTAQRMYLHPNTIRYRLSRINEVMGRDIFHDSEECLYLQISLHTLLQEASGTEDP